MSNSKKKYPTVGKGFSTEQEALTFLQTILPTGWPRRTQSPDFGVDWQIEVAEKGELTGLHFALQVKGRRRVGYQDSQPRLRMYTKNLAYYRDRVRLPLFIALIDTTKKSAHWLFAQKYLRDAVNRTDIENKKRLTLLFDPKDSFSDLARFRVAIEMADRYMRDLYPGSPDAAISARKEELQALDPDIDVDISFNNGVKVKIVPKKPTSFQFRGRNADDFASYQAMLDHGEDFKAEVDIISATSPLFQKLMSSGKGVIQFTPDGLKGCVQIIYAASPQRTIQVTGLWRGGRKSLRFEAPLEESPLRVQLRIEDFLEDRVPKTSFDTPCCLKNWEGQPISRLAWFEEIHCFITSLATEQEFRVNYFVNGVNAGGFNAVPTASGAIRRLKNTLDWLAKAQFVARHYGSDAVLPGWTKITSKMESQVDALWGLATSNAIEVPIPGIILPPIRVAPNIKLPEHWGSSSKIPSGVMKWVGTETFDFFGEKIDVADIEQIFTEMELVSIEPDFTSKQLTFRGRDGASLTRRKVA